MGILKSPMMSLDFVATSAMLQNSVKQSHNAQIELIDPNISGGTYDRWTNTDSGRNPVVLWSGAARIQAMRWPNVATARQEAVSVRTVVFHIPLDAEIDVTMIREGFRIRVTDGGLLPDFTGGLFVITTSVNSSYAWDRRIEAMQDQGVDLTA